MQSLVVMVRAGVVNDDPVHGGCRARGVSRFSSSLSASRSGVLERRPRDEMLASYPLFTERVEARESGMLGK
jgi:hypothetical protein